MKDFDLLKTFMSQAKSVERWNELRDVAKKYYSPELINELDSSGYIKKVLKKV